jgi:hypothetical protein
MKKKIEDYPPNDRLIEIMKDQGLNPHSLATMLGYSRAVTIRNAVNGIHKISLDTARDIIRLFGEYNGEWVIGVAPDSEKLMKWKSLYHQKVEECNALAEKLIEERESKTMYKDISELQKDKIKILEAGRTNEDSKSA